MSSARPSKRRRLVDDDRISPPPLRRKRDVDASKPSIARDQQKMTTNDVNLEDSFQIFSWNVNSITHLLPKRQKSIKSFFTPSSPQGEDDSEENENSKSAPLRTFLRRHKWPQFLGLQEVKISPKDEATRHAVEKAANGDEGPSYKAYFSLPRDKYNATGWGGKVHGVCTLLREDVAELPGQRTREVDWDLEGRVLVTELPSFLTKLVVINGYCESRLIVDFMY